MNSVVAYLPLYGRKWYNWLIFFILFSLSSLFSLLFSVLSHRFPLSYKLLILIRYCRSSSPISHRLHFASSSSSPIGINVSINVEVRSECSSQSWASTLRSWLWALTLRWGEIFNSSHLTNSYKVRALSSGLSNVPNAKYLAHLTHQTQKQTLIRYAKFAKIIEHATVRSHFWERMDENVISIYCFFIHLSLSSLITFSLLSPSLFISSLSILPAQDLSYLCSRSLAASPRRQPP